MYLIPSVSLCSQIKLLPQILSFFLIHSSLDFSMDKRPRKQEQTVSCYSEEVSSIEWEFINMTKQEEDLIHRMYRLVGDRWSLIAGRIPGRKPEEIERFWIMTYGEGFARKREELNKCKCS